LHTLDDTSISFKWSIGSLSIAQNSINLFIGLNIQVNFQKNTLSNLLFIAICCYYKLT